MSWLSSWTWTCFVTNEVLVNINSCVPLYMKWFKFPVVSPVESHLLLPHSDVIIPAYPDYCQILYPQYHCLSLLPPICHNEVLKEKTGLLFGVTTLAVPPPPLPPHRICCIALRTALTRMAYTNGLTQLLQLTNKKATSRITWCTRHPHLRQK